MPPAPAPGPTISLPQAEAVGATVTRAAPVVGEFDEDTRVLLWWRLLELHIAALVIMTILGLLAGSGALDTPSLSVPAWSAISTVAVMAELVGGTLFLWRRPDLSLRGLRVVECLHFGVAVAAAGLDKYAWLAIQAVDTTRDPALAVFFSANTSQFGFIMPVVVYGALIPNPPRRGLIGVGLIAAVPFLVTLAAAAANPLLGPFLPTLLIVCAVQLTMPVLVAVFVASRNHALQRRAFEAERRADELGQYTLKNKLGAGGMGEVFLAEHRLLKRACAVKFIRPELATNPATVARFAREVQAVTGLTHFNTVRVYDYGRADDGSFYYVMEYLDGPTLESLVRRAGPLDPARAVYMLRQVCGALAEAHAAGLVHRDLKPGNIIVAALGGQRDVAKVLDFGLVQDLSVTDMKLTAAGVVLGTPAYMCPEQAGGSAVDSRGDIYSLGAVAFFALTGRPPFERNTVGEYLTAHLTRLPPDVRDQRAEVPADLAAVVARCLSKDPAARFASATELDRALAACACAGDWSAEAAAAWWDGAGVDGPAAGATPTATFPRPEPTPV